MKKRRNIVCLFVVVLMIGGIAGVVRYRQQQSTATGVGAAEDIKKTGKIEATGEQEDVRQDYDVLREEEINLDNVSEGYLFNVESLLDEKDGEQSVLNVIRSVAQDEFKGKFVYVSKRPIYYWNAAQSNVDTARMEIAFFDKKRSKIGVCYLLLADDFKILDVEGRIYENSETIKKAKQQKFISVSVSGPGVISEEMLLSEENDIVTPNNGPGPNSFQVTVEGEYYDRISHIKDLAFSFSDLIQEENLMKLYTTSSPEEG